MVRENDTGKRKRSSVQQNNRLGERIIIRDPKIRKAKPEESRKCKARRLHVEEQPMEMGKQREEEIRAAFVKGMTERHIAFYKTVMEEDYGRDLYITEDMMPYYPFGVDEARELNDYARKSVRELKEIAAVRIKEYEETGCLEGFPPSQLTSEVVTRLVNEKH